MSEMRGCFSHVARRDTQEEKADRKNFSGIRDRDAQQIAGPPSRRDDPHCTGFGEAEGRIVTARFLVMQRRTCRRTLIEAK